MSERTNKLPSTLRVDSVVSERTMQWTYNDVSVGGFGVDFSSAKIEHFRAENLRHFTPNDQQLAVCWNDTLVDDRLMS